MVSSPAGIPFDQRIRIPGSWQSLRAFGEEFLADDNSLHQASALRCNWRNRGVQPGCRRRFPWKNDTRVQLVLGAVSGLQRSGWRKRKLAVPWTFIRPAVSGLGRAQGRQSYTLTVKVLYPFEGDQCCFWKTGILVYGQPRIWQNVWLEEERKVWIS